MKRGTKVAVLEVGGVPVSFFYEGTTADTGDPCYEVSTDAGSYAFLAYARDDKKVYVHLVDSRRKGDFSKMMDAVSVYFDTPVLIFTNLLNFSLLSRLRNTETFYIDFMGDKMLCAKTIWEVRHDVRRVFPESP